MKDLRTKQDYIQRYLDAREQMISNNTIYPLLIAAIANDPDGDWNSLEQILKSEIDLNFQVKSGLTLLFFAIYNQNLNVARILINAGSDVDIQSENGITVLMDATYRNRSDVVQMLIKAKANLDLQNIGGATALMIASEYGHLEIAELLIEAGANNWWHVCSRASIFKITGKTHH